MRITVSGVLIALTLAGCTTTPPVDRESKLLTMAAGEAQQIPDSTARLTRQLNFASQQMSRGKTDESRQSLAYAAQTLRDAKPGDLTSQIRIAGWVSISELSREGSDLSTAHMACEQSVAVLQSLQPISDRPQYVIGVANEVQALDGKPAAAKLLEASADWIKQVEGVTMQRVALVAVADATFYCEDYAGGLTILRTDDDAAWRSDTLAMLADENRIFRDSNGNIILNAGSGSRTLDWVSNVGNAAVPASVPSADAASSFSKPVDYKSVFSQSKSRN
jgi:hypothetical protein